MTRDIIEINEELCDGCGDCVIGCSEGAIQIVDGKAKLVKEEFCDGFGDCVGVCPTGALTIIKRAAPEFDEAATRQHLFSTGGEEAVRKFEQAQARHEHNHGGGCPGSAMREISPEPRHTFAPLPVQERPANGGQQHQASHGHAHHGGGCPGSAARKLKRDAAPARQAAPAMGASPAIIPSELGQWPVQLHLVQPFAPYFQDAELVVMSTCGPIASAEVHQRYLRGRAVVVACPKLDNTDPYAQKLAGIFREANTPKVIIVIMEVPCCGGLTQIVGQGVAMSGRQDLVVEQHVLSLDGNVKRIDVLT